MAREVTLVDAGLGNLASVERALVQVGAGVRITSDPDRVATSRMVVFPGQSAFGTATQAIVDGAMGAALRMVIERGDPFLGICLGMQLLFDGSDENGGQEGLHVLPGWCRRFPLDLDTEAETGARETVPMPADPIPSDAHPPQSESQYTEPDEDRSTRIDVEPEPGPDVHDDATGEPRPAHLQSVSPLPNAAAEGPRPADLPPGAPPAGPGNPNQGGSVAYAVTPAPVITPVPVVVAPEPAVDPESLPALRRRLKVPHMGWNSVEPTGDHYYFVHSFYVEATRADDIMWMSNYGSIRFPAAVRRNNVLGCQFHPEKSQRAGLKFLRAFLLGRLGLIVLPSIDLSNGEVVRLTQGQASERTVYDVKPFDLLERYLRAGVARVHVVDLDGAFAGEPRQIDLVSELSARAAKLGGGISVGGGLRDAAAIDTLIEAGAAAVVVGTLAVRAPEIVEAACDRHPGAIVIAADARDGWVAIEGWTAGTDLGARTLAETAQSWGAAAVLYTDVVRDGRGVGPNVQATAALQAGLDIPVWASGGVGSLAHLDACKAANIRGVVVGRALLEGAFTIEEAMARC